MNLIATDTSPTAQSTGLRAGHALPQSVMTRITRFMALEACKWDAQVADVPTLTRFP